MLKASICGVFPILVLATACSSQAADISACDLIDKATASQIIGSPVTKGPTPSRHTFANSVKTYCDLGAEGPPIAVVTVAVSEFKSSAEASAFAGKAKTGRGPGGHVETENLRGNDAVWWSQQHAAGYVVSKGALVLEVLVRGAAAGERRFEIIPDMRHQLREATLRALEKL